MTAVNLFVNLLAQTLIQIGVIHWPRYFGRISGGSGGIRGFITCIGLFTTREVDFHKVARLLILVSVGTLSAIIATVLLRYSGRAADMDGFSLATYTVRRVALLSGNTT